jgi:hypothetical protein
VKPSQLREVVLDRLHLHASHRMPLLEPQFTVEQINRAADGLVAEVSGYLWSERIARTEFRYPRDWKESVKERFAPWWVKRRWPVVYTVQVVDARVAYPEFKPSVQGSAVRVVQRFTETQGAADEA